PGAQDALESWADEIYAAVASGTGTGATPETHHEPTRGGMALTDRLDRVFTHPVFGMLAFVVVMAALFWSIFSLARLPMDLIEKVFALAGGWVKNVMPDGILRDLLADGVITGIGSTAMFLPQIC